MTSTRDGPDASPDIAIASGAGGTERGSARPLPQDRGVYWSLGSLVRLLVARRAALDLAERGEHIGCLAGTEHEAADPDETPSDVLRARRDDDMAGVEVETDPVRAVATEHDRPEGEATTRRADRRPSVEVLNRDLIDESDDRWERVPGVGATVGEDVGGVVDVELAAPGEHLRLERAQHRAVVRNDPEAWHLTLRRPGASAGNEALDGGLGREDLRSEGTGPDEKCRHPRPPNVLGVGATEHHPGKIAQQDCNRLAVAVADLDQVRSLPVVRVLVGRRRDDLDRRSPGRVLVLGWLNGSRKPRRVGRSGSGPRWRPGAGGR